MSSSAGATSGSGELQSQGGVVAESISAKSPEPVREKVLWGRASRFESARTVEPPYEVEKGESGHKHLSAKSVQSAEEAAAKPMSKDDDRDIVFRAMEEELDDLRESVRRKNEEIVKQDREKARLEVTNDVISKDCEDRKRKEVADKVHISQLEGSLAASMAEAGQLRARLVESKAEAGQLRARLVESIAESGAQRDYLSRVQEYVDDVAAADAARDAQEAPPRYSPPEPSEVASTEGGAAVPPTTPASASDVSPPTGVVSGSLVQSPARRGQSKACTIL